MRGNKKREQLGSRSYGLRYTIPFQGSTLAKFPDFPTLRVAYLYIIGELIYTRGLFNIRERPLPLCLPLIYVHLLHLVRFNVRQGLP